MNKDTSIRSTAPTYDDSEVTDSIRYGCCKMTLKRYIDVYERHPQFFHVLLVNILVFTRVARCHTCILLVYTFKISDIAVHILRIWSYYIRIYIYEQFQY
jgi:hypothetical protein